MPVPPLKVAVKVFWSPPLDSEVRPVSSAPSAAESVPNAEIWVLSELCCAVNAATWPAVFEFTRAVTSVDTSSDELPVAPVMTDCMACCRAALSAATVADAALRSEEHTSELQSRFDLVCRLLLEKKKETYFCSCCSSRDLDSSR